MSRENIYPVRLSDEEDEMLWRQADKSGQSKASAVRQLIHRATEEDQANQRIVRHQTIIDTYAAVSTNGSWGGYIDEENQGSAYAVETNVDQAIQQALDILGGRYMTNTKELRSVTTVPLTMGDGSVFLIITVTASLEPNKMRDMRFLKGVEKDGY